MSRRTPGEHWYRTPEQRAERDRVIVEGRLRGAPYKEIGEQLRLSPGRVCSLAKRLEREGVLPKARGPRTWVGYGTSGAAKYGVQPGSMKTLFADLPFDLYANLCAMAADHGHSTIAAYLRQVLSGVPELQQRLPSRSALALSVVPGGRGAAGAGS